MAQSSLHVAIVMDGNGRWAERRGLQRVAGHRVGATAVRHVVETAPDLGIGALTLFAFSADNWKRPASEVATLMRLFARHLRTETPRCVANGVVLRVIGRRDRLPGPLVEAIDAAHAATAAGTRLELRIAVDYSSRHAIETGRLLPDVDLLIRTGGEYRCPTSVVECAYAELYFTTTMWPDFGAADSPPPSPGSTPATVATAASRRPHDYRQPRPHFLRALHHRRARHICPWRRVRPGAAPQKSGVGALDRAP
jgi:undecaprenyl diphosphate synthase